MLALAAYVYVVAEMAPIGATPAIAADLGVSEARIGMLTAAYAFVVVLATLPLVRCTARWPRRRVLVLTLTCLTVSQALSALAPDLTALAASRVLCALTHGLMWAVVVPIGARLVPATHTGRATTAIYIGTSAALVMGNPLTTAMSEAWGWRQAVGVLAIAAAAVTMLAASVLPKMAADADPAVLTRKPLAYRNNRLIVLCALTFVGVTAHFASFTFVVPIIRDVVGIGGPGESWILVGFGAAGLLALATLAGALDRRVRAAAAGAAAILCLAFFALSALSAGGVDRRTAVGVAAILVWGAAAALLPPLLQSAAIRTCPAEPERASALYVTVFQVGIMAGSLSGGLVYGHNGIGAVVTVSAMLFALAFAGVLLRGDVFDRPASRRPQP